MDKLLTIQQAADLVGAKPWQVRRAVNRGLIPHFAPFNSRKFVRLSDVLAVIEASRKGGQS
ncbi:helix-turn-helix domain-containing protein [Bosea sp. FBZP-16]|uniref:helix-turn-helix domain-containing protein n=1 Tax=Bosea sp. FBZP-16 TaxID=2065382 RepID=UPI000C30F989|nr:helix-turn-helix domain-containing protein [Bosea sp. FBZP-16]